MNKTASSAYTSGAYKSEKIPPLPEAPKKRSRVGEELLPFGDYAHIDPYQQVCADAELVQYMEEEDNQFYESDDWWWDNQSIRFIKSQLGLSVLLMAFPFLYLCFLLAFPFYFSYLTVVYMQDHDYNAVLAIFIALIIAGGGC